MNRSWEMTIVATGVENRGHLWICPLIGMRSLTEKFTIYAAVKRMKKVAGKGIEDM